MGDSTAARLRKAMSDGLVVAPFIYDGLTAKIAEHHGFGAVYMTGHGTSAQAGFPDFGMLSFREMVNNLSYIAEAVSVPVIADADTGYGNALNVGRTVREYESAGAAALHMEDQTFPKKCGFFEGKQVVPVDEYLGKLRSALDARQGDLVIIARTDALAVSGWDEVEARTHAYREAGADLVFVDGIKTADDLAEYSKRVIKAGIPALYNGSLAPTQEVGSLGFSLMITGGGHGLSYMAVKRAMQEVKSGSYQYGDRSRLDFNGITDLLGLPEIYELEGRFGRPIPVSSSAAQR